jgi:hypothetical protein
MIIRIRVFFTYKFVRFVNCPWQLILIEAVIMFKYIKYISARWEAQPSLASSVFSIFGFHVFLFFHFCRVSSARLFACVYPRFLNLCTHGKICSFHTKKSKFAGSRALMASWIQSTLKMEVETDVGLQLHSHKADRPRRLHYIRSPFTLQPWRRRRYVPPKRW